MTTPIGTAPPVEPTNEKLLLPFSEYDPIVLKNSIIKQGFWIKTQNPTFEILSQSKVAQPPPYTEGDINKGVGDGTFKGSQKALTAIYSGIVDSHTTYFDIAGFETSTPRGLVELKAARELYTWSDPEQDNYPPHLAVIPSKDSVSLTQIFNKLRLAVTVPLVLNILPSRVIDFFYSRPEDGQSIQDLVQRNHDLRKKGGGLFDSPNIGDRDDWYTDAVFAQQQLTGTNPVTLTGAGEWLKQFLEAATKQKNQAAIDLLNGKAPDANPNDSFYVQDFSWFRKAIGLDPTAKIQSDNGERRTSAPVTLFRLMANGKLHPIAICIDFKVSFDNSVVLFNKRLLVTDDKSSEITDWPWRYAKTVVQCADWHRHEVGVHLTESHFIEEATIVAANRSFPETHMVYQLLSPHWYKTLSLNAAARSTLVPSVVVPIGGMGTKQLFDFAKYIYTNFDFTKTHYVPNDLNSRGFPVNEIQDPNNVKFHNCAYARDILLFWNMLRTFISTVLRAEYAADVNVANDKYVQSWCQEMQDKDKGAMASFPTIKTIDELVDAVTACIHVASPLHSAINYLQNYYYAFVINKPSALFTDLPTTLDDLKNIKEKDLMNALPVNHDREWLLASHIPWLLSYQVAENRNVLTWAASLANATYDSKDHNQQVLGKAARQLYQDMIDMADVVASNSRAMDDQGTPYSVLTPKQVAVSILI